MQAELQRLLTAIAGIEARMAANNQGISELSLSYSQLTERVEKDSAAQDLLKRLAGWLSFGLYKTLKINPRSGMVNIFFLFSSSVYIVKAMQAAWVQKKKKKLLKNC